MQNFESSSEQQLDTAPWYRQPWAWFILTPLMAAVCSSSVFVYLAFSAGDDVIMDNYYKEGRLINIRLEQDERAAELNMRGLIDFDMTTGEVFVELHSDSQLPADLLLLLSHPVSEERDQQLPLKQVSENRYRTDLTHALEYRWYIRVLPAADSLTQNSAEWRLLSEIDFRSDSRAEFIAR